MRKLALTILAASAGLSFAGESAKQGLIPAASIPQVSSDCADCLKHSGLFLGAGVDYFFEAEEVYYNGRIGHEWAGVTGNYSQSLFLEVGWFEDEETFSDAEAIPITLNYEYKRALYKCLNFYVGVGAGIAIVESQTFDDPDKGPADRLTDNDDTVFFFQAFAGLTYCLTNQVELYAGARYIWSDDFGPLDGFDDWSLGAGLRMKF